MRKQVELHGEKDLKELEEKYSACFIGDINYDIPTKVPAEMHMSLETIRGYKRPYLY